MFRPGHVGDHRRPLDRRAASAARTRRDPALRAARLDRRRRVRRGPHRVRLRDLGRRRADDAGVSPHELFVGDLPPRRHRPLRRRQGDARERSAAHARGEARAALLRRPVGGAVEVHHATSASSISVIFSIGAIIGAMITMYASVASRTGEIGTLRALGFSRGVDPRGVPARVAAARARRRRRRARRRVVHAGAVDLDDELPDVRRARVLVHADAARSSSRRWRFRWRWDSSAASCRPRAPRG